MNRNQFRQNISELFSAALLCISGYRVVARNKKIAGVEVDILAYRKQKEAKIYVVAEVKFRSRIDLSAGAISSTQYKRLQMAADKVAFQTASPVRIDAFLWQPAFPWVKWVQHI